MTRVCCLTNRRRRRLRRPEHRVWFVVWHGALPLRVKSVCVIKRLLASNTKTHIWSGLATFASMLH